VKILKRDNLYLFNELFYKYATI